MRDSNSPAKGRNYLVEVSVVAWIDLLGYGTMLRRAAFDPTVPESLEAIRRLLAFHETIVAAESIRLHLAILNDGAVAYLDLSPRSRSVTYDFLAQTLDLQDAVNKRDQAAGHPGARMIIAAGFRHRGFPRKELGVPADNLVRNAKYGMLDPVQAIHKALRLRRGVRTIPELQANFAFTRAFLADASGSRAGLAGPQCYLDMCLVSDPPPDWIEFDQLVPWAVEGMSTTFGRVVTIDRKAAGRIHHAGIRNALEVADALSPHIGAADRVRGLVLRDNLRPTRTETKTHLTSE